MKIRYTHASNPGKERIYNTDDAYKNLLGFWENTGVKKTREQFANEELVRFQENHFKGFVLSFEVIEESGGMENDSN